MLVRAMAVRPTRKVRIDNSWGSTRAGSYFLGVTFPTGKGKFPRALIRDSCLCGFLPRGWAVRVTTCGDDRIGSNKNAWTSWEGGLRPAEPLARNGRIR